MLKLKMPPAYATVVEITNGDELVISQNNMGEDMEVVLTPDQAQRLVEFIKDRMHDGHFVEPANG